MNDENDFLNNFYFDDDDMMENDVYDDDDGNVKIFDDYFFMIGKR